MRNSARGSAEILLWSVCTATAPEEWMSDLKGLRHPHCITPPITVIAV